MLHSILSARWSLVVLRRLVCALASLLILATAASGQTETNGSTPGGLSRGAPAGSYALSGFDNVNLFNGHMNFRLPLLGVSGRGSAGYQMTLPVEQTWTIFKQKNEITGVVTYAPEPNWWTGIKPGYGAGALQGRKGGTGSLYCGQNSPWYRYTKTLTRLTFTAGDGTEFELRDQLTSGEPRSPVNCTTGFNRGKVFFTADGTAATFISDADIVDTVIVQEDTATVSPSGYLLLRDGTRYRILNGTIDWMRDRNGNKISFLYDSLKRVTSITDSLGRQISITYAPLNSSGSDVISYNGFGGAARTVSVNYDFLQNALRSGQVLQTPLQLFPDTNGTNSTYYNPIVIKSVTLPNSQQYQLFYNSYGEIARAILPTGAAVEYDYAAGLSDGAASGSFGGGAQGKHVYRRIIERRSYPTGNSGAAYESKMTYSRPETTTASNLGYVVTEQCTSSGTLGVCGGAPALLAKQKYYFYGSPRSSFYQDAVSYGSWQEGREYRTEEYDTNGTTVLRIVESTFAQRAAVAWWILDPLAAPPNDPRITVTKTTIEPSGANLVSQQTAINPQNPNIIGFDQYNNQTDVWASDFGSGGPGAILRHTHTDYLTTNSVNGLAYDTLNPSPANPNVSATIHLRSLPVATRVYAVNPANGVETVAAQSTVSYDEPGYAAAPYGSVTGWIDPGPARGNATTSGNWLDTTGAYLLAHLQYDQCGNVRQRWDARDTGLTNPTQVSYSDAFSDGVPRNTFAFPTSMTTAVPDPNGTYGSNVALTTTSVYDFNTGKVFSMADANGKTTSYDYSDSLERVKQVNLPDGGRTTYTYVDAHQCGPYVETRTLLDTSGREADSYQFFDGLGRPTRTFAYENQDTNNPYLTVDTQYDPMGRAWRVSSPYRSPGCLAAVNPSGQWTTTAYDALGRVVSATTTADNAVVSTAYSGNTVTVTDQAGKTRRSVTDALGRLARVDEPDSNGNLGSTSAPTQPTNYTYDVLGNLRKVDQGSQQRFFMYDSLSRLIRAKNPEQLPGSVASNITDPITGNTQWSMAYGYDNNGNLTARVDARDVTTTYAYDALNRNTTVRYTDGTKDIDRHYDNPTANKNGLGRLWYSNWDPNNNTRFDSHLAIDQYDAMGRPSNYRQHFLTNGTASPQFNVARTYDKAGHVLTQTYPSGHTVNYGYDIAGRLNSDAGNLGDGVARSYAGSITYSEFGGMQQEQFGTQTALYHKHHYNVRGQLYDIRLSSVAWANDQWDWNRGGVVNYYAQNYQWQASDAYNNGNVLRSESPIPLDANSTYGSGGAGPYSTSVDTYSYDNLNRLASVQENQYQSGGSLIPVFTQAYSYDRWGNRTINQGQTTTNVPHPNYTADPSNNRLVAPAGYNYGYDNAGNQTNDNYTGQGARTYDGENRMKQAWANSQWQTYTYDADGRRLKRNVNGVETWAIYGMDGELLAEYASGAAPFLPSTEYGYRNGELLVTITNGDAQRLNRFVTNLYYGALQRDPTSQELADKVNQLASAGAQSQAQLLTTASQIARSLFTATSYETSPYRSDTQYVSDLYYAYLQRGADDGGLGYWVWAMGSNGRENVCNAFEASGEFQTLVANLYGTAASDNERTEHFVNNFYLGAYGRSATATELQQQRDALNAAAAQSQTAVQTQAETFGRSLFTGQVNDASLSDTQYVTNLYEAFLQRGPDAGGLGYWSGQASVGTGRQNVLNAFAVCSAFRELSGTLYREANWLVTDQIGTPRLIVNKSGSLAGVKRHDYLPFGEELSAGIGGRTTAQGYTGDSVRQKFTSKERDNETGLDYLGARYYASMQGRFTGSDPSAKSILRSYPQSWNSYSYVYNNPLVLVDQNGKWPTAIHELIIDRALPGLTKQQRQQIKNGSYSVDDPLRGGQSTENANEHGLTKPGQSQQEAAENADTFINTNVDHAKYAYEHTGLTSSLWDFGRAFHTVSDMTSPEHEGYQVWHWQNALCHIRGESSIDNYRLGLATGATLALYRYAYNAAEYQKATGYTPGTANDPNVRAIEAEYSLPGSFELGLGEALYEYRNGLREGLKFDWGRQGGLRYKSR